MDTEGGFDRPFLLAHLSKMTLEIWQLILALAGTLGVGGLLKLGYDHWLKKPQIKIGIEKTDADIDKLDAETETIHLSNQDLELQLVDKRIEKSEKLLDRAENYLEVIATLKEEKFADRLRLERRDGVIEYQRTEIIGLHNDIKELHGRVMMLTDDVRKLTEKIGDVTRLNLQLQGTLDHLRAEGIWDGVLKNL